MAKLSLLGDFWLQDLAHGTVAVATLKGRALLAYLACAKDRSASRDSLALLLWSESDGRKSKRNLRQVLFKLSRILARHDLPILHIDAQRVTLRAGEVWADTWEMDALAKTESLSDLVRVGQLYRGEFLQGLILDAPVFGDWLADMRTHFQNQALNSLYRLLECRRETGDLDGAISTGLRALEIDPSEEQIHRALMGMYLAKGMRGAALTQYRTCRSVLRRDLDVAPEPSTEVIYRQIRASGHDSLPAGGAPVKPAPAPPEASRGRAAEFEALHKSFSEACRHGARVFALSGEAGIGKTHLIDGFARQLEKRGVPIFRIAARQAEQEIPLALWHRVSGVLPPLRDTSLPEDTAGLREVTLAYGDAKEGLTRDRAQGPAIAILEDLQWADGDSLQRLGRDLHNLGQKPILFVTAARLWPEMDPAGIAPVQRDLEKAGLIRHRQLKPLSFGDSMALLDEAFAARGLLPLNARQRNRRWKIAQGNPEALLSRSAPSTRDDALSLPRNLRHSARQIMARLSSYEQILVHLASLAQGPLGGAIFTHVARWEPRSVAASLDNLVTRQLLRKKGGKFSIARPWFAEAVRRSMPANFRRSLHGAIASAIREQESQDLAPHYEALAYHHRAAGEEDAALGYRLSALEAAVARGARNRVSRELDSLTRSLPARSPDPKLNAVIWRAGFLRAALAEADADPASALQHLRALERRGPRDDDPNAAATLFLALSRACCVAGDAADGLRYARRSLLLAADLGGVQGPWKLSERLLFRSHLHVPAAAEVISGLKASARKARMKNAWSSLGEIATAQAMMEGLSGRFAAMRDSFDTARASLARQPGPQAEAALLQIDGMTQNWTGGGSRAVAVLGKALTLSRAMGDLIGSCVLRGRRGQAYLAQGLLEESRTDLEQAITEANALGSIPYLPLFYSWLAEVSCRNGRHAAAAKHARHALCLSYKRGQAWTRAPVLRSLAHGLAHAHRPDIDAAGRAIREAIAIQQFLGIRVGVANSHLTYAEVRHAAGDAAGARTLRRQAREMHRSLGIG